MTEKRFEEITARYSQLRVAVVGDFCLDRYLEIDRAKSEISIETGLEVHNVVSVRSQPGAAGTILNNLVSLGIGEIIPIGFCGDDGEGYELIRALKTKTGVRLDHFLQTSERHTFTYCKPLVLEPGQPPRELNRLDSKNWSPTPASVQNAIANSLCAVAEFADALILMDQVDLAGTGVINGNLLDTIDFIVTSRPKQLIIADSRRSLKNWPRVCLKMNECELAALTGATLADLAAVKDTASALAREKERAIFITLAERGIVGADTHGRVEHIPSFPVRGPIDIVGAGDAVTANLCAAMAAGAMLSEALELAMAAASVVIHQLGTTGVACAEDIRSLLAPE